MATRLHLSLGSRTWNATVAKHDVRLDAETTLHVVAEDGRLRAAQGDSSHHGNAATSGDEVWVTVGGEVFVFTVTHGTRGPRSSTAGDEAFTPPMAATVVRIAVRPGERVDDGAVLIALEAMKMELPIRAPRAGIVRAVHCREGELVQPGQVLIDFE